MNFRNIIRQIKIKIANRFFKDVMNSNARTYLKYVDDPAVGIKELHSIANHRILTRLECNLKKGILDKTLYDELYNFYLKTPFYDFNSMHYELSRSYLEVIEEFENNENKIVEKEQLYFFRALCQIASSNTIGAMANWELANLERVRVSRSPFSILDLIHKLPINTITNPIEQSYRNNLFLKTLSTKYPLLFAGDFKTVASKLNQIDAMSFLSCGLKNVQTAGLISKYQNKLHLNKIFAQEIINSLCIICESTIKDYPEVGIAIRDKKKRQIGNMLSPSCLSTINPSLSSILGNSTGGYSGMYLTLENVMKESDFNNEFPNYISELETNTYPIDELKARILVGLHSLRNKVLHDNDDTLCFYNDADLFIKSIGLLLVAVTITQKLRP